MIPINFLTSYFGFNFDRKITFILKSCMVTFWNWCLHTDDKKYIEIHKEIEKVSISWGGVVIQNPLDFLGPRAGYYSLYPSRTFVHMYELTVSELVDGRTGTGRYIGGWILWGYGRHFIFRHTVRFRKAHCPCACPSDVLGRNSNSLLQLLLHFFHASRLLPPVQTRPRGDQQPP